MTTDDNYTALFAECAAELRAERAALALLTIMRAELRRVLMRVGEFYTEFGVAEDDINAFVKLHRDVRAAVHNAKGGDA